MSDLNLRKFVLSLPSSESDTADEPVAEISTIYEPQILLYDHEPPSPKSTPTPLIRVLPPATPVSDHPISSRPVDDPPIRIELPRPSSAPRPATSVETAEPPAPATALIPERGKPVRRRLRWDRIIRILLLIVLTFFTSFANILSSFLEGLTPTPGQKIEVVCRCACPFPPDHGAEAQCILEGAAEATPSSTPPPPAPPPPPSLLSRITLPSVVYTLVASTFLAWVPWGWFVSH